MQCQKMRTAKFEWPVGIEKVINQLNDSVELSQSVSGLTRSTLVRVGNEFGFNCPTMPIFLCPVVSHSRWSESASQPLYQRSLA